MPDVTIYTTPTCSWCAVASRFLEEHDVQYAECDIFDNPRKAEELVYISSQTGVPVLDIDGEIVVGLDRSRSAELRGHRRGVRRPHPDFASGRDDVRDFNRGDNLLCITQVGTFPF